LLYKFFGARPGPLDPKNLIILTTQLKPGGYYFHHGRDGWPLSTLN
jgi:hypothetical protein